VPKDAAPPAASTRRVRVLAGMAGGLVLAVVAAAAWARGTSVVDSNPSKPAALPRSAISDAVPSSVDERKIARHSAPALPATAQDLGREGVASYSRGDFESALSRLEAAATARPDDPEALNNLGQALVRLNRPQEAVRPLEAAVGLAPDKWAYRFNLARARGLSGDWNGAVEDYCVADRLFPDDHATLFNLALALRKSGRAADAIPALERVTMLEPADSSFLLMLGRTYDELDRTAEAAGVYRRFLSKAAGSPEADSVRARLSQLETSGTNAALLGSPDQDRQP
jgi:Flp pilus assembly protein TadD